MNGRTRRVPRAVNALLVTMAVACTDAAGPAEDEVLAPGSGPEGIELEVVGDRFRSGDVFQVVLRNDGEFAIEARLCEAVLERRSGTEWVEVRRQEPELSCALIQLILGPGESVAEWQAVESWMDPGVYRLRTEVHTVRMSRPHPTPIPAPRVGLVVGAGADVETESLLMSNEFAIRGG